MVEVVGWIVTWVAGMVVGVLLRGWVLTVMWGWFMIPTFGLPRLSIPNALGLSLMIGMLTAHLAKGPDRDRDARERFADSMAASLGASLLALGFGWLVHLFM